MKHVVYEAQLVSRVALFRHEVDAESPDQAVRMVEEGHNAAVLVNRRDVGDEHFGVRGLAAELPEDNHQEDAEERAITMLERAEADQVFLHQDLMETLSRWADEADGIMSKGCPVGQLVADTREVLKRAGGVR